MKKSNLALFGFAIAAATLFEACGPSQDELNAADRTRYDILATQKVEGNDTSYCITESQLKDFEDNDQNITQRAKASAHAIFPKTKDNGTVELVYLIDNRFIRENDLTPHYSR